MRDDQKGEAVNFRPKAQENLVFLEVPVFLVASDRAGDAPEKLKALIALKILRSPACGA